MNASTILCDCRSAMLRALVPFLSICTGAAAADDAGTASMAQIGPVGRIVEVARDLKFTEGPASDARGNVYFSDVAGDTIYRHGADGNLSVFARPSKHANGLMFNAAGELVACQMDGQIVAYGSDGKIARTLAGEFGGKRFNAPNDLVIDASGGIYFTDPRFRAPMPLPQGGEGVYYVAGGKVTRLIDDLKAPNGVILSPDEKTLYVIPSQQREKMAYRVLGPGKLDKGRVFCRADGGDGLTVDTEGNVYIATRIGVEVFTPEGKRRGVIKFPQQPANVTFGGPDGQTLYVTARTALYSVTMKTTGHRFPAGKME
jgi:gluconolactonase